MIGVQVTGSLGNKNYARGIESGLPEFLTASAVRVHGEAFLLAPVDTSFMRNSIAWEVKTPFAEVNANAEYSIHVEYGTVKQKAQPFMRPGLDNSLADIRVLGRRYLKRVINI